MASRRPTTPSSQSRRPLNNAIFTHHMTDLLIEIGTEDLPARYQQALVNALCKGLTDGLQARGVSQAQARAFVTPRRIAVRIASVAERQQDRRIERLGPSMKLALKDGQPSPAALGFARSCGVAFDALGEKNGKLHFSTTEPGQPTGTLIQAVFDEALKKMDALVPKRMRWADGDDTFVRPVQWLLCLFGSQVVPLQAFGLTADRLSYGHRFHAPAAITLQQPSDYEVQLKSAWVVADFQARKSEVRRQILAQAAQHQGHARISDDLLEEVTALVEWPVAISGRFEAEFLQLPPEVIVATVETNQRYFTVFCDEQQTQLTNAFITVSNIESRDMAQVIGGNERVVRPRLGDALFFWQQDLKQPLEHYCSSLEKVTFHKALGSIADKAARIEQLAAEIARRLGEDPVPVARAAALCKADLVTRMVFEFPELQGLMGGYYAQRGGEPEAVSRAIAEHYLPTQQGTPIPASRAGQILAMADKIDSLAGIFAAGQKPTASKDPFALRRAALGVLRIIREANLDLHWPSLMLEAIQLQTVDEAQKLKAGSELMSFIEDRYRNLCVGAPLAEGGAAVTPEQFDAVASAKGDLLPEALDAEAGEAQAQRYAQARHNDIQDFESRLAAVQQFMELPEAGDLAAANKRVRNILRQAQADDAEVDPGRFEHDAEHGLFNAIAALEAKQAQTQEYSRKLIDLAALREPIDAFFDGVMVNADDPSLRANRLALLTRFDLLCRQVADLSRLPG